MSFNYFVGYELGLDSVGRPLASEAIDGRLTDDVKKAKAHADLKEKLTKMPIAGQLLSLCIINRQGDVVVDCADPSLAAVELINYIDASEPASVFFGFEIRDVVRTAYLYALSRAPASIKMGGGTLLMPNLPGKLLEDDVMFVDPYHDTLKADVQKQFSLNAFCSYLNVGGDASRESRPYVAQALKVRALVTALRL